MFYMELWGQIQVVIVIAWVNIFQKIPFSGYYYFVSQNENLLPKLKKKSTFYESFQKQLEPMGTLAERKYFSSKFEENFCIPNNNRD